MSSVTNIILVTSMADGGAEYQHPNVDLLNRWLRARGGECDALVEIGHHTGGGKHMECEVWVAAINFNDDDALIREFASVPWEYPEMAQLMLKCEQEDRFTIYQLTSDRRLQFASMVAEDQAVEIQSLRAALSELWSKQDPDAWDAEFAAEVSAMCKA